MPPDDLIARLQHVQVRAAVALGDLEELAAHRQHRRAWAAAIVVILVAAVPVQWFLASETAQVRIDDPAATVETELDAPISDPDRPWEPDELGRVTIDAAQTPEQLGLPVAFSVRASDGDWNRTSGLWITWAETEPFGAGATVVRGHRTLYGAPLYNLDVVAVGDHVHVSLPDGATRTYVVTNAQTLPAGQPPQMAHPEGSEEEWLLITTPDPRFTSAEDLLVVTAQRLR